jgi:hypothetical protein
MKNKYNIPVLVNIPLITNGNFIDHYSFGFGDNILKRRNISNLLRFNSFGISLMIKKNLVT